MTRADYPYGFRVVGPVTGARRLVVAAAAFSAHAACDRRAEPDTECYLSAFRFGADFRAHFDALQTPKGFAGRCWSPWLWADIDRADPAHALADARKLAGFALERYRKFDDDDLLLFFSGRKGFHVGVPLTHNPDPAPAFHQAARRLAVGLAAGAGVAIDTGLYDRVRLFRAPNSRHPKTGLSKRRLTCRELMNLTADRIAELAREPAAFDEPKVGGPVAELEADWREAEAAAGEAAAARSGRPHPGRLQRATLDFLRDGAEVGSRHLMLFRAAADMAELAAVGGVPALIHALLTERGLDDGITPSDVERRIRCGVEHGTRAGGAKGGGA